MLSPNDTILGIKTLYPRYVGIPVVPLEIYSFSVQIKVEVAPVVGGIVILWFNENGDSQDVVGQADLGPGPINDTNWHTYLSQGTAPTTAAYAVPGIYFTSRPAGTNPDYSPSIYFCASQFSRIGTAATVAASSPDRYLTLGAAEEIGAPRETPPFPGYLIGDPTP